MKSERYDYLPAIHRKPIRWPNEARLAVWVILNVEHFEIDSAFEGGGGRIPDIRNYGWRDYSSRVGIWRLMELLDKHKIRATVALNAAICEHNPIVVEEGKKRGWEFMGHGITNSRQLMKISEQEERSIIKSTVDTIAQCAGKRPQGWLSPGLTETFDTPDILAEEGIRYVSDWCNDDQPYAMKVKRGSLLSIPYSVEVNDRPVFLTHHLTALDFHQIIKDQFDVLYEEGARSGKVMAIALHPYLTGQPFRAKYFDAALAHIARHKDVWFATGCEIADWYRDHCMEQG